MARLLLVETNPFMQRTLQKLFSAEEHVCTVAGNSPEARSALECDSFDLLVLDVGRLRAEGLDLLRYIRTQHHVPILLLAPLGDVSDMVAGLETGADDYMCEPFDPRELMARVQAQLRRAHEYRDPVGHQQRMDLGGIILDIDQRDAFREGVALKLTTREFDLLHLLARYRGKALASPWIVEHVWGGATNLGIKALAVQVGRVRRKIELDWHQPRLLMSIRGFGYQLAMTAQ